MDKKDIYNFVYEYSDGMYLNLYERMKDKISYKIQKELQNGAYYEYNNYIIITLTDMQYKFVSKFIKYIKQSDYSNIDDEDIEIDIQNKKITLLFKDNKPLIHDEDDLIRILLIIMEFFDVKINNSLKII